MERSGLSKTVGETKWEGVSKKSGGRGGEVKNCPTPLPAPFFSHSLAVSFPLRPFGNERLVRKLKRLGIMDKDEVYHKQMKIQRQKYKTLNARFSFFTCELSSAILCVK